MTEAIGQYQIRRSLGKGGMGEVFLVYDPFCGREVALKKIRSDYVNHPTIQKRFLREAKIASQLTHPSIIAVYTIHQDPQQVYYTMPYVEGDTLKSILITTSQQEKNGEPLHEIGGSIPTLIRIFLNICSAIRYVHKKGILHRDLKPENIIIGKFGEVIILDWGLADYIHHKDLEELPTISDQTQDITRPGTIPGTLSYMAPERALGEPTSVQTEIYSLGVILYQMLALRLPFKRKSLKSFKKMHAHEVLIDPEEAAPDRDISYQLSEITKKCLDPNKHKRYQNVDDLVEDIEHYLEGLPDWKKEASLQIRHKDDWQFQENVIMSKHLAITRQSEIIEWVNMMVSKQFFSGNTKVEAALELKRESQGIGFLLCVQENGVKEGALKEIFLWMGSSQKPGTSLFRRQVEVLHFPELFLTPNQTHRIRIELIDHHLSMYLNDKLKISYLSHLPFIGGHLGLLTRDAAFTLKELNVFTGSQQVMVNCLAIPDAFLAKGNYALALSEYRRIAQSFPGRTEGTTALFRSGMTLLEQAKMKKGARKLLQASLDEFGKLHSTPGAPLEYLGKSLVYQTTGEIEEEIKCFELALRKFPKHPLKPVLVEQLLSRLYECTGKNRKAAFAFSLLSLWHLPHLFSYPEHQAFLSTLEQHLEPLYFLEPFEPKTKYLALQLAFWLNKPLTLIEMFEQARHDSEKTNILLALWHLGHHQLVKEKVFSNPNAAFAQELIPCLQKNRPVHNA